ncbi:putative neural-cadherin 2 [Taenia solium]|eukprot:TsM_000675800 transcript=TsM_000675800 gene=TsM_000675800
MRACKVAGIEALVLCLCIFAPFLPQTRSNEYPECRHGGVREIINGRTFCHCPRNRVNTGPLCETVRVNFENLQTPLTAAKAVIPSLPLHISLEFICKDFRGTGVLFTLGDSKNGLIFELALNYGQPVIALNGRRQIATVGSLHDNEWHRIDLFMSKTPIGVDVILVVDRCVHKRRCGRKLTFNGITTTSTISGPLTLSSPSVDGHRLSELCLENIAINSQHRLTERNESGRRPGLEPRELVDVFEATTTRLRARGCPKCEEACFFSEAINDTGRCGSEGICRNPIVAAIDQYVCTCRPGYQPVLQTDPFNGNSLNISLPCVQREFSEISTSDFILWWHQNVRHQQQLVYDEGPSRQRDWRLLAQLQVQEIIRAKVLRSSNRLLETYQIATPSGEASNGGSNESEMDQFILPLLAVQEWQVKGPTLINLGGKGGFTVHLSLRTRHRETPVLRSRDGRLRLVIFGGKLEFHLDTSSLTLPGVDMTDGLWHMCQLWSQPNH